MIPLLTKLDELENALREYKLRTERAEEASLRDVCALGEFANCHWLYLEPEAKE